jgi:hypothetical protein
VQTNTDSAAILNGPQLAGDDVTAGMGDRFGNACDADDDNDGASDTAEAAFPDATCTAATGPTNALDRDSDGDHLLDWWECQNGSNPLNSTSRALGSGSADADGDHVLDLWERRGHGTSLSSLDSDSDGCPDLVEVASVDTNRAVGDADRLAVARRVLGIWPADPDQDYAFDHTKNGVMEDTDRLFAARAALIWVPPPCS